MEESSQFKRVCPHVRARERAGKEASMDQHNGSPGSVGGFSSKDTHGRADSPSSTADLRAHAPMSRWLGTVMHTAFFLLLGASLARFLLRHPGEPRTPGIIALSITLAVLYVLAPAPGAAPSTRRPVWLGAVVGAWVVLVVLAPSFAWCAVPLFYTGLRTLPTRAALALVAVLTALVVGAQLRLADSFDPNLAFAPPAVAAVATAVFIHMQRQTEYQRALIDDLIRTRRELAATERREGTLAERQRLSMEIHDTLAQGLSSQQMLLQAADRVWDADPATARAHVRSAVSITERGLVEARRFVHDLAPADLAEAGADDGEALPSALSTLAERETTARLEIRFHAEGKPVPLPGRTQSALLRIAQGALANVREHADASAAALTLTYLGDQVVLDIADDGKGFVVTGEGRGIAAARGDQDPTDARSEGTTGTASGEGAHGDREEAYAEEGAYVGREEAYVEEGAYIGREDTPVGREEASLRTGEVFRTEEVAREAFRTREVEAGERGGGARGPSGGGDGSVRSAAHDGHGAASQVPASAAASRGAGSDADLRLITDAGRRPATARDLGSGVRRGHGLPAIHARARQLGGTLTVESTPGEGTVLSVLIPLAAEPSRPSKPSPPAAPPQSAPSPEGWPPSGSTHEQ
nr:histidine kinase [Streptomyces typhae]